MYKNLTWWQSRDDQNDCKDYNSNCSEVILETLRFKKKGKKALLHRLRLGTA